MAGFWPLTSILANSENRARDLKRLVFISKYITGKSPLSGSNQNPNPQSPLLISTGRKMCLLVLNLAHYHYFIAFSRDARPNGKWDLQYEMRILYGKNTADDI